MEGGSDAAAERAVDAATVALSRYEFFRVHEEPLGERPTFGSGPTAAAARLHESDRPKVLVCRSTKAYRRLALCVPRPGERTVDIGSAYGDATALMAEAAGKDAVLGIDVSKHFVDQSSAARPGLRFERLDALEDPALLAREIEGSVNVFVDIGGVRAAEALVRLLPAVAKSASPSFIVVKCEALHDAMADAEVPFEGLRGATTITRFTVPERERSNDGALNGVDDVDDADCGSSDSKWRDAVAVTASSASSVFWRKTCEREVGNVRARSAFKRTHVARSARPASDLFARYPLKYPPRFVRGDVEICRFHNYSADGCIRREKFGMCMFDHEHCHWCGEHGHRAWECEHAVKAHQSAVVDDGLAPAATPVRDPNDGTLANGIANGGVDGTLANGIANGGVDGLANGMDGLANVSLEDHEDVYVYVAGGRNRGQTVGVTERYSPRRKRWERGPHISDPRGSHGLAAANGVVYAVAGGGIKSNLATAEALHAVADHASTAWVPAGAVAEARHALSACNTGDWGVCAIGGWADGNSCTGAVDFLDLRTDPTSATWRSLAPLNTPRKLHGAAGLPDGRLFVFGGRIGDDARAGPIAGAEAYDPTSNAWRDVCPLPFGACACACVDGSEQSSHRSVDGSDERSRRSVYVATWGADNPEGNASTKRGGKDPRVGEAGALWRYDPDADTYERMCGLPLPDWYGFAMCAFDGWVYLVGGSTAGRWTGAAFRKKVDEGGESEWEELPPMKMQDVENTVLRPAVPAMLASLARRCGVAHRGFWREDGRSFARTLSTSASDQESALQNAMLSSFQRWFEAYGGKLHSGISMVQTPSIGWGLTASRDVDVGERLILLPRVLQMTYSLQDRESTSSSDQTTAELDRGPDTPLYLKGLIAKVPDELWSVRLGLALLHERALGGKSPFFQYISLLPAMHRGLPLFFGPEAVDALQYLPLVVQVKRRSRFLIDFSSGPLKDVTAGKDGETETVPFDGYSVGADALGWAFACASSRAFRVAGEGKPAAMLPLIDVANHSFEASAEVRAAVGEGPGAIEMVASRPLRAGDEVTLNYGNLSNDHFLLDYGFVPQGINKQDTASLRWDVGYLEAAREVAGLAQVPFAAGTEPWQSAMLSQLGLDEDPEVLVTRDERQPVDARLLAGIRVLYASGPEDFSGGGSGEASQPLRHGALLESTLDRTKEAYALRTAQAALALALGNFPTTLKEDETKLEELTAELAKLSGVGDALEKENLALAVKFRKGKKEVISRAMKAIDERLRVVLAS